MLCLWISPPDHLSAHVLIFNDTKHTYSENKKNYQQSFFVFHWQFKLYQRQFISLTYNAFLFTFPHFLDECLSLFTLIASAHLFHISISSHNSFYKYRSSCGSFVRTLTFFILHSFAWYFHFFFFYFIKIISKLLWYIFYSIVLWSILGAFR